MNVTRRSVLAAVAATVGAAGCTGTNDDPAPAAQKNGPEATVRNLLSAIESGNQQRIAELTLAESFEIEQQSVSIAEVTVHAAARYADRHGEETTAVRERMNNYVQEEGFENYAFVYVDAELGANGPYDGYVTVVKDDRWQVAEW